MQRMHENHERTKRGEGLVSDGTRKHIATFKERYPNDSWPESMEAMLEDDIILDQLSAHFLWMSLFAANN